jgi:hypothetical protein
MPWPNSKANSNAISRRKNVSIEAKRGVYNGLVFATNFQVPYLKTELLTH